MSVRKVKSIKYTSPQESNHEEDDDEGDLLKDVDQASGASTTSAADLSTLAAASTEKSPPPLSNDTSDSPAQSPESPSVVSLKHVPFTRDLNPDSILKLGQFIHSGSVEDNTMPPTIQQFAPDSPYPDSATVQQQYESLTRRTTGTSGAIGAIKVTAEAHCSKTFQALPLPEPLSIAHRVVKSGQRRYPNTPLALAWYESGNEWYLFVGLLGRPHLLKIVPPKHTKPDKPGRFNALPIDHTQVLLADEASHQIQLLNYQRTTMKHLAGCGKRGHIDGPLDSCRMHSPCSMTLDPRSHFIYIADRGNHVIRKIDLMSGLMSTVVGNGIRGNSDGSDPRRQALDSPFEVSWVEPHYLVISCADNSIRSFNLKTQHLETILVGS